MPLFNKKTPTKAGSPTNTTTTAASNGHDQIMTQQQSQQSMTKQPPAVPPQLVFHCQLANGSPTALIFGFSSVKELYQKIAECYDISVDEVTNYSWIL